MAVRAADAVGRHVIGVSNGVQVVPFTPVKGVLDTTFDTDGIAVATVGTTRTVVMQPDWKIVAVGWTWRTNNDFVVMRYKTDGSIDDVGFGGGTGMVITDLGGDDYAYAVTMQPDGKILVTGDAATAVILRLGS